jgi:hypothetical protein
MKKNTNYRKWSFKFLIYVIILNFLIAYMIVNSVNQTDLVIQLEANEATTNYPGIYLHILTILTNLLFITGIVLTILTFKNKEKRDYKYKVSIYGYPIFIIISIFMLFI